MANAFQKQLLKAGLVSKDKVNKANKQKHKKNRQQPKNQKTEADELKLEIQQSCQAKTTHDRELNYKKVEDENKKAIIAQIIQLIEMNRITDTEGDVVFNFENENKIKHIYVSEDLREQIINGHLAIVRLNEQYELVPKIVADKISQRDDSFVVLCNESDLGHDEEDEYADYKVPDDLMW